METGGLSADAEPFEEHLEDLVAHHLGAVRGTGPGDARRLTPGEECPGLVGLADERNAEPLEETGLLGDALHDGGEEAGIVDEAAPDVDVVEQVLGKVIGSLAECGGEAGHPDRRPRYGGQQDDAGAGEAGAFCCQDTAHPPAGDQHVGFDAVDQHTSDSGCAPSGTYQAGR